MYKIDKSWSKMTKIEKRKTLAQDVILHIKSKYIIPQLKYYCDIDDNIVNLDNLQEDLQKKNACNVCAMGSLMVASIIKTNKFDNYWDDYQIIDRLKGVFSEAHLRLIETAFEKKIIDKDLLTDNYREPISIAQEAIKFGKKYLINNRIIAIMKNIISDKKGKFLSNKL